MRKRGIHEGELVSLLAASGAMAETIPPSLVLIIIGSVAGVSIAALFTGGLLPGIVLAIALAIIARRRMSEGPNVNRRHATAREIGRTFVIAVPALLLPILIRLSVMYGVATATEVATIGIAYAIVAGLVIYRTFDWEQVYPALVGTAWLAGAFCSSSAPDGDVLGADPIVLLPRPRGCPRARAWRSVWLSFRGRSSCS